MSIKLPAGHGRTALPLKNVRQFKNNLPIVIRECLANAITYRATRCHAARFGFPEGLFLCVMHDGEPFQGGVEEIKSLGLTPNNSSNQGWSFQGNGLTYCASYLRDQPKLVIASKKEGVISVASATIDYARNDWLINDEPGWEHNLRMVLGPDWLDKMNVFYLFLLPDSEKEEAVEQNFGMKYANILTFLAPGMVAKTYSGPNSPPQMTISEGIFYPGKQKESGEQMTSFSDCPAGSWRRNLVSPEEFQERFCEHKWSFDTPEFPLVRGSWEYTMRARITILAFPGIRSRSKKGVDNRQWLANIRSGSFGGKSFREGSGVGMGVKPNFTTYLYAPVIGSSAVEEGERYGRFKDNAVGYTWRSQNFFNKLGLPYNDKERRSKDDDRPFAILQVEVTALGDSITSLQTGEKQPVSDLYFANDCGRRADFLFDTEAVNAILNAATGAVDTEVPEECRRWFREKFPSHEQERVPIQFGDLILGTEPDQYRIYDLATGQEFSHEFHSGQTEVLAIWSFRRKKFVAEAQESSISRGIEITRFPTEHLDVNPRFSTGYEVLHSRSVAESKVTSDESIPCYRVKVAKLSKMEDGVWVPIETFEYQPNDPHYQPSRGVHSVIDGKNVRLGHVVEVPVPVRKGRPPVRTRGTTTQLDGVQLDPYDDRDARIFVTWDDKRRFLKLNINNRRIKDLYDVADSVGSRSQKLLQELYLTLTSLAFGVFQATSAPVSCDPGPAANLVVDDEEAPIYHSNPWDYVINQTVEHFMASSPYVLNLVASVEEIRRAMVA